jgi:nitrile hydratase accessory protein
MTAGELPAEPAPPIPGCDATGPVFGEPWEAQAFALVVALHARGLFSWSEWAQHLSQAIARAQSRGDPDLGASYYRHWLDALETLVAERGLAPPLALGALRQAWRSAAEITAHGQPVVLPAGLRALGRRP